ncbi:trimeric intracellular cation channel family protein [Catellatospora tritici]|uniref:trimeric intracellular cation channel family protein n=1 Tax=Catellatospora tritici TaxID=2851566 RepID=UPI001C2D19DA|nr:trimeric intracellular cation channel family protein [Catellatospora tritici]MBV1851500.1 trimeric intracellular cation channel family protein [Catellatospora tritici]
MDSTSTLLLIGDLTGVAVFAASGGSAAVGKRLDIFGVVFVGFVAALGGGILRDLVINQVPPLVFANWRYPATAIAASLAVFWLHPHLERLRRTVYGLDAAGLGLFTVTSTLKALDAGVPAFGACLLGMLTGIGGGLVRDLLLGEIPVVLRREIYAVASLLGAIMVAVLAGSGLGNALTYTAAVLLVFVVRITALYRRWSAPRPRVSTGASPGTAQTAPGSLGAGPGVAGMTPDASGTTPGSSTELS